MMNQKQIFWPLFLFGCGEVPLPTETKEEEILNDADGDGFFESDDCDDNDAQINPSASEICDGLDNDCDGVNDEDVQNTYYVDGDSDGFGNPLITTQACDNPQGYVSNGTDCDDTERTVYPSAEELCDGMDNDCDTSVDEDLDMDFLVDNDGDGFGDDANIVSGCRPEIGLTTIGGDCDDSNAGISPVANEICDEIDNDCDDTIDEGVQNTYYADSDSDQYGDANNTMLGCSIQMGYVSNSLDCDDINSQINPSALEYCDQLDNDCDGEIDELGAQDSSIWYEDGDSDGYGAAAETLFACSQPEGYVENSSDCDDNDNDTSPAAEELCNGEDDNCNGSIDEEGATDALTWYADDDADGFGDENTTMLSCSQPNGYVVNDDDCDDRDDDVYPQADEICNGEDDNCDEQIDEDAAVDAIVWYQDLDGDGFGDNDVSITQCAQPNDFIAISGDCDDSDTDENEDGVLDGFAINPDSEEICDGIDNNCDSEIDEGSAIDANLYFEDNDGDGFGNIDEPMFSCITPDEYVENSLDCNDNNDSIHPDSDEVCDSKDNNCDGDVDEDSAVDAIIQYADDDDDGYGDPNDMKTSCIELEEHVLDNTDCDDRDNDVYPGADELCNGEDDNCDESVDEDSAVDAIVWYLDEDEDGFGSDDNTTLSCVQPDNYSQNGGDCNDSLSEPNASNINPAAVEVCNEIDDNCNNVIDDNTVEGNLVYYEDADGDGFGSPDVTLVSCAQPIGFLSNDDDCDDSDDSIYPSAPELCDGQVNACGTSLSSDEIDNDEDGFVECSIDINGWDGVSIFNGDDCDDSDDSVYPSAPELCDGQVNACGTSLSSDEIDNDGDGSVECSIDSSGWNGVLEVTSGDDCDDANAMSYVGAAEICDGEDNDCNFSIDEGLVFVDWYQDEDGDGYGNSTIVNACSQPDGYVDNGDDCNDDPDDDIDGDGDGDGASIYPGAVTEATNDECMIDVDGDGFGDGTPPSQYDPGTDCDDTSATELAGCISSCNDYFNAGYDVDGEYIIDPDGVGGEEPMSVYCDFDGSAGWTLCASLTKGYVPSYMLHEQDAYAFQARLNSNRDYVYEREAPSSSNDMWNNSETLNYGQFCRHMGSDVQQTKLQAKMYNWCNNYGSCTKNNSYSLTREGIFGGNLFINWFTDSSSSRSINYQSGDQLFEQTSNNASQFGQSSHPYIVPNMGWVSTNQNSPYTHSTNPWSSVGSSTNCVGCTNSSGYNTLPYGQTSILNNMSHSFWDGIPNMPYGWSDCTANGNCDYHESGYGVWLFWVK